MKSTNPWNPVEDVILEQGVLQHASAERVNWHTVAARLPRRTNKECRKRWAYCLAPSIRKGTWAPDEDQRLVEGLRIYGTKWSAISRHVVSRQADQCARHWHEVLKGGISRGRWSLLEDETLKNAVKAHGKHWTEIVERYFYDRTPIAARNRYHQITKLT